MLACDLLHQQLGQLDLHSQCRHVDLAVADRGCDGDDGCGLQLMSRDDDAGGVLLEWECTSLRCHSNCTSIFLEHGHAEWACLVFF